MKKFMPAFSVAVFAALLVVPLSGCFGNQAEAPAPVPKQATNVEIIEVPPGEKTGFSDIVVFDIERDGQILTCTTKAGYNSGVGCVKKEQ